MDTVSMTNMWMDHENEYMKNFKDVIDLLFPSFYNNNGNNNTNAL